MRLDNRLMMIAKKIPHCDTLADIGADHGYIPIYALSNGLCNKAVATDLRSGPLKATLRNVRKYGFEGRIAIRQGDGLGPVEYNECDVIVAAGMGGMLIQTILESSPEKAKKARLLLLQPNNAAYRLRKWLYENGFDILDEVLSFDSGKFYSLILAAWKGVSVKKDEFEYYIGKKIIDAADPLLYPYCVKKLKILEKIIEGKRKARNESRKQGAGVTEISIDRYVDIRDRLADLIEDMKAFTID